MVFCDRDVEPPMHADNADRIMANRRDKESEYRRQETEW
jgi:hypothetical protein